MPYAAWHASFSATCSETWACSGAAGSVVATVLRSSRVTARTEWMAAPTTTSEPSASRWLDRSVTRRAHWCALPSEYLACTPSGAAPNPDDR